MAEVSITQVWDPVAKQYVSATGTGGVQDVAITGGVTVTGGATEAKQDDTNTLLADIDANTDGLEAKLDTGNTSAATTATKTTAIADSVDGLEAGQTSTNAKLDTLLSQTDGIEASIDGLEGYLAPAESSFDSIAAAASGTPKTGAGVLFSLYARNDDASTTLFFWAWDNTATSGTKLFAPIKLTPGQQLFLESYFSPRGKKITTGITWGFSTSGSSFSAYGTTASCVVSGTYT